MFGFLKRFRKSESDKPAGTEPSAGTAPEEGEDLVEVSDGVSGQSGSQHTSPAQTPPEPPVGMPAAPTAAPGESSGGAATRDAPAEEPARPVPDSAVGPAPVPEKTRPAPDGPLPQPLPGGPSPEGAAADSEQAPPAPTDGGLFARLRSRLAKTRRSFTEGLADLVLGKKSIDDELLEELETRLILADVGLPATRAMIDNLTGRVSRRELTDPEALFEALYDLMVERLRQVEHPLAIPDEGRPFVILMTGINGAGKTTTIGKLAHRLGQEGKSVMLAAGDTFRAAAVEQLQIWGERNGVPVIGRPDMRDAGAVVFDAVQAAQARGVDVLIADTAGRLHTQSGLMEELKKLTRVMRKVKPEAPQEVLLVLDASIGQNALAQARQFHEAVGVTGLVITKLDGTAKGGIVFAIAEELGLPIRYIGVGERPDDLRPFEARAYVDAMLDRERPDA
ncbi:MAG: signal recognition particle-docking protein FtsY [Halothiobacillaceae bacterium]